MSDDLQHLSEPENQLAQIKLPETNDAFVKSEVHFWNGKKLHPFDVMRMSAAYVMGLRYGRWRENDLKEWADSGVYSNLPNDTVIVLYICSLPKEARMVKVGTGDDSSYVQPHTVPRIFDDPSTARNLAYEWAAKEAISFGDEESMGKAANAFLDIMREIDASKFKAIPKDDGKSQVSSDSSPNA